MLLIDALGLGADDRVEIVGAGGKTTLMYRLAEEAAARGWKTIVGGTTRFTPPRAGAMPSVVVLAAGAAPAEPVQAALEREHVITLTAGRGDKGRLLPVEEEQVAALAGMHGVLMLFEADGSRNRPFKAPGVHEPAIPSSATVVVAVVGLEVVGQPLHERWVHRPEEVMLLSGAPAGTAVTAEVVSRVLLDPHGGRKGVPATARWLPVLNQAEPARHAAGRAIAGLLLQGGAERVVLCTARAPDPVVEVVSPPAQADWPPS